MAQETDDERLAREAREYIDKEYGNFNGNSNNTQLSNNTTTVDTPSVGNDNSELISLVKEKEKESQLGPMEKTVMSGIESAPTLGEAGAGMVGGKLLRSFVVPKEYQYNPAQTPTDIKNLIDQHQNAFEQHQQNLQQLSQTQLEHEFAKTLKPDDFLPERLQPREGLTGGEKWSSNWAGQDRPGVGSVPDASAAYQRSKGQGKITSRQTKLYGPKGQNEPADLVERMQQKSAQAEELARAKELAKQHHANHLATAQKNLEDAKIAAQESAEQLKQSKQNLTVPEKQSALNDKDMIGRYFKQYGEPGTYTRALAKLGARYLPTMVPGAGAAFAPIAVEKGIKQIKEGNPVQGALHLIGGAGNVAQATNVPWLMGAGDIMQMAPLAAEAFELGNNLNTKKPAP